MSLLCHSNYIIQMSDQEMLDAGGGVRGIAPGAEPSQDITPTVIKALRDGEHAAYDKVFLRYYNRALGFVSAFVKVREDAEDIVEDIFVSLWVGRERLAPDRNFNLCFYAMVRGAVLGHVNSQDTEEICLEPIPHVGKIDEEFIAAETKRLIGVAVDVMPRERQAVFSMNYNDGLDNAEISRRLKISLPAVEKHLKLALEDIRKTVAAFLAMLSA